jgi:hypothetical protein
MSPELDLEAIPTHRDRRPQPAATGLASVVRRALMRLRWRGRRCSRGARRALGGAAIEAAAQPAKRELRSSCFAFPPVRAGRF